MCLFSFSCSSRNNCVWWTKEDSIWRATSSRWLMLFSFDPFSWSCGVGFRPWLPLRSLLLQSAKFIRCGLSSRKTFELFVLFFSVAFHSKKALLLDPSLRCCGDVLKGTWCCWFFVESSGCIRSGLCRPWGGRRLGIGWGCFGNFIWGRDCRGRNGKAYADVSANRESQDKLWSNPSRFCLATVGTEDGLCSTFGSSVGSVLLLLLFVVIGLVRLKNGWLQIIFAAGLPFTVFCVMTFVENGMETKLLGATLTEQEPASPIGWGSANFLLVARKLLSTSALMVSWPLVDCRRIKSSLLSLPWAFAWSVILLISSPSPPEL